MTETIRSDSAEATEACGEDPRRPPRAGRCDPPRGRSRRGQDHPGARARPRPRRRRNRCLVTHLRPAPELWLRRAGDHHGPPRRSLSSWREDLGSPRNRHRGCAVGSRKRSPRSNGRRTSSRPGSLVMQGCGGSSSPPKPAMHDGSRSSHPGSVSNGWNRKGARNARTSQDLPQRRRAAEPSPGLNREGAIDADGICTRHDRQTTPI